MRESAQIRDMLAETKRDPAMFHFAKRVYLAVDNDKARGEKRIREWFKNRYKNSDLGPKVAIWGSSCGMHGKNSRAGAGGRAADCFQSDVR